MKMRWLAACLTAVLILGGTLTIVQRAITQKTRGVLPEANDSAHADSRRAAPVLALPAPEAVTPPVPVPSAVDVAIATAPAEPALVLPPGDPSADPATPQAPVSPTVAVSEPTTGPALPSDPGPPPTLAQAPPTALPAGAIDSGPAPAADPAEGVAAAPSPPGPAVTPGPRDVLSDPVRSVESFVEQNRREADHAIQTLTNEAENLKGRLAKVEVALTRWQTFSRALNADLPPGGGNPPVAGSPASKGGWRTAPPEHPDTKSTADRPLDPEATPALRPAPADESAPDLVPVPSRAAKSSTALPEPTSAPIPETNPIPAEPTAPPADLPPPGEAPKASLPDPSMPPIDPTPEPATIPKAAPRR